MTGDVAPLSDVEADALLAPLARFGTLVLAVSGGADSTALMHLAHGWRSRGRTATPAPHLIVATVDHGLRRESSAEARDVGRQALALGIEHRILLWDEEKPSTGLQAAARAARRRLLAEVADQCRRTSTGPVAVVTAHTADDQAETLLMRLARGSGVDGLAAIPSESTLDVPGIAHGGSGIPMLRPLLQVPHARLVATLAAAGLSFVEDPSNRDTRFERARVREALCLLDGLGLTRAALSRTAMRMQAAKRVLDEAANDLAARAVTVVLGIVHEVDCDMLTSAPHETTVRLLRRCLSAMGGEAPRAGLSAIEDAARRITSAEHGAVFTLGGCIVEIVRPRRGRASFVRLLREPDRDGGLPRLRLRPGACALWDARFRVFVRKEHAEEVEVGPLGADWPRLCSSYPFLADLPVPAAAARGMPAFRCGQRLVAAPLLAQFALARGERSAALALAGPCSGTDDSDPIADADLRAIAVGDVRFGSSGVRSA